MEKKEEKTTVKEVPVQSSNALSQIIIIIVKIILCFVLIGSISTAIGLIIASIILFVLATANLLFLWIGLILVSGAIFSTQLSVILIKFLANKDLHLIPNVIVLLISIVLAILSSAMTVVAVANIKFINNNSCFNMTNKEIKIDYEENLVIESIGIGSHSKYNYIVDETVEDNKIIISREIEPKYFELETKESTNDKLPVIQVDQKFKDNFKELFDFFVENLKKNKVYTLRDYSKEPLVIKAKKETINKLVENVKKLYLVEETKTDNEITISIKKDKVYFKNGVKGRYNAITDTIEYDVDNYSCKKEIENTKYGDRIIYTCSYTEDD